jgi:hypothetical protein
VLWGKGDRAFWGRGHESEWWMENSSDFAFFFFWLSFCNPHDLELAMHLCWLLTVNLT